MEQEYLTLFSNTGNIKVQVFFNGSDSTIQEQKLEASEIRKLVNYDGKSFISKMRFDGYLAEIKKIDIRLPENIISLYVEFN